MRAKTVGSPFGVMSYTRMVVIELFEVLQLNLSKEHDFDCSGACI